MSLLLDDDVEETVTHAALGLNELPTPPDPVHFGPTWEINPDWRPNDPTSPYKYLLPETTLGWEIQAWVEGVPELGIPANILSDDTDEHGVPLPFRFTQEQLRFVLWMYAVDERGRFVFRDIVLQRLKGWGKDPLAAVIAAVEFVGPCRFAGWAMVDLPDKGLRMGDPVGKRHPRAWVQVAAVSKDQPLALHTRVRTPRGWKTVADLTIGDLVFDESGNAQVVRRETEVLHDLDCYRITFDDGKQIVASASHGWTVERKRLRGDYHVVETLTTEQMAAGYLDSKGGRRIRIPLAPTETPDVDLPIDPYILGLWLGDGNRRNGSFAIDWRQRDEFEGILAPLLGPNEQITFTFAQNNTGMMNIRNASRHATNGPALITRLRDLGVLYNKRIPEVYAFAGTDQRRALLQGLIDSDGCVLPDGQVRFTNADPRLIDGARELVESLGYKAHVRATGPNAQIVGFRPGTEPVARLSAKFGRQRPRVKPQSTYRYVTKVERVESVPVKCIGIDTPSHLFQVEGGILTHNTKNTMTLFPGLFSPACVAEHAIDIGKEVIYAHHGRCRIEAVTSSPKALEGGRPTLVVKNEALALDTPIPTPSGWTTMGELKDGDVIYGSDGKPTIVTKAHPVQHGRRCFRVTFGEGDSVVASDGHWWKVRVANNRRCATREMTTLEMLEAGREFWLPDLPDSLDGEAADLPIDPYILGLWLGDGNSRCAQIACDSRDIDEVAAELTRLGVRNVSKTGKRGLHLILSESTAIDRPVGWKDRSIQSRLRAMGLLENKHIPAIYLRASLEQRLALLQGLMDSDGSIRPNGAARFTNANERLIEGARELLLSLGYQCQKATWQVRDEDQWPNRSHWQPMGYISFIAYAERNPFRLTRKMKHARSGPMPVRSRKIAKIEEIDSVPVRCISVSAESRLFLAGLGMHATRNTHHWLSNNNGHEMAEVIERNAVKSKDGAARTFSITNAYDPGQESVAQQERESWEQENESGWTISTMYDSLEAHPSALIALPPVWTGHDDEGRKTFREPSEAEYREYVGAVIRAVRGDAVWLDVENITTKILQPKSDVTQSRRFYYNQVLAAEDAWVPSQAIQAAVDRSVMDLRRLAGADVLRAGWAPVGRDEEIVMFFDGSKSFDSTGLVGCRVSDGYTFLIGVWQQPKGMPDGKWLAPRWEVDERVHEAHKRFNIVAFFGDPSHALEDDDDTRYWDGFLDDWHQTYHPRYKVWAVRTGDNRHSVMWDMTSPQRQDSFVKAAERTRGEFTQKNDVEEFEPTFKIDGHPAFMTHLRNARAYYHPKGYGVSVHKGSRMSKRKIDLAVCAIGARMLRRLVLNAEEQKEDEKPKASVVW